MIERKQHLSNTKAAFSQRACFVKTNGRELTQFLKKLTTPDENLVCGSTGKCAHVSDRRGDDECTRASHNEKDQGHFDPIKCSMPVHEKPRHHSHQTGKHNHRWCVYFGKRFHALFCLRTACIGLLNEFHHARHSGIARRSHSLHFKIATSYIDSASGKFCALPLHNRHRLSRQSALIKTGFTLHNHSIHGNFLASTQAQKIANSHTFDWYFLIGLRHSCFLGLQVQERHQSITGLGRCFIFKPLR
mmetsp:Transcript_76849/g.152061  ORF Transcript_76849/g.152061 Transcript_76849/m.152061 type:complete len:246 (+) Transcript_76849:965-1702(+)